MSKLQLHMHTLAQTHAHARTHRLVHMHTLTQASGMWAL